MLMRAFKMFSYAAATIACIQFPLFANMPDSATETFKIEALCSISNAYATCHPQISNDRLIINFPNELVVLLPEEVIDVKIYDSTRREIIRLFQRVGDIDFAISFNKDNEVWTGFVRFKNNRSARIFKARINIFKSQK